MPNVATFHAPAHRAGPMINAAAGQEFARPRNDTHQLPFAKMMGFADSSTHPAR